MVLEELSDVNWPVDNNCVRYYHNAIRQCKACPLAKQKIRGGLTPISGIGPRYAPIMFIGRNPGAEENRYGEPFWTSAPAGDRLEAAILQIGLARHQVYLTNVVKCFTLGNVKPTAEAIGICMEKWLLGEIGSIKPSIIVTLGKVATQALSIYMKERARSTWPCLAFASMTHPSGANRSPIMEARFRRETRNLERLLKAVEKCREPKGDEFIELCMPWREIDGGLT